MEFSSIESEYSLYAKCLFDNKSETPEELSFERNQLLVVLEADVVGQSGWSLCRTLDGHSQGFCPTNRLMFLRMNSNSVQQFCSRSQSLPHLLRSLSPNSSSQHKYNNGFEDISRRKSWNSFQTQQKSLQKSTILTQMNKSEDNCCYDTIPAQQLYDVPRDLNPKSISLSMNSSLNQRLSDFSINSFDSSFRSKNSSENSLKKTFCEDFSDNCYSIPLNNKKVNNFSENYSKTIPLIEINTKDVTDSCSAKIDATLGDTLYNNIKENNLYSIPSKQKNQIKEYLDPKEARILLNCSEKQLMGSLDKILSKFLIGRNWKEMLEQNKELKEELFENLKEFLKDLKILTEFSRNVFYCYSKQNNKSLDKSFEKKLLQTFEQLLRNEILMNRLVDELMTSGMREVKDNQCLDELIELIRQSGDDVKRVISIILGNFKVLFEMKEKPELRQKPELKPKPEIKPKPNLTSEQTKRPLPPIPVITTSDDVMDDNNDYENDYEDYVCLESKNVFEKRIKTNVFSEENDFLDKNETQIRDQHILDFYREEIEEKRNQLKESLNQFLILLSEPKSQPKVFVQMSKISLIYGQKLVFILNSILRTIKDEIYGKKLKQISENFSQQLRKMFGLTKRAINDFPSKESIVVLKESIIDLSQNVSRIKV